MAMATTDTDHDHDPDRTVLTGEVTGWRTQPKADTGWHIAYVTDDAGTEHTVTGCSLPRVGAYVQALGKWEDTRYGRQFHVRTVAKSAPPLTAAGVARWLRERVPGVGPTRAALLLEHFDGDAVRLWAALAAPHAHDWTRANVSPDVIRAAAEALATEGADGSYQALLYGWGMTQRQIAKVKKHWSLDEATVLLHDNPYLLADHVDGFGFHRADAVATRMGIGPTDPVRLRAAVLHYLEAAINEGHVFADRPVMQAIARETRVSIDRLLDTVRELKADGRVVVEDGARVYLPELHAAECAIAADLRQRFAGYPRTVEPEGWADVFDVRVVDAAVGELAADPWQARAIDAIADTTRPIVFVTGGPGTGKTTVLKRALERLQADGVTVHLAAPTGKAAKRMIEATGQPASTLHSLLGYRPASTVDCDVCRAAESSFDYGTLTTDDGDDVKRVIIVDESSMVDVRLWAALVAAARGTCLRFVGDAHQLPPVGGGQPFRDALDVAPGGAVVRLRTVYRSKGEWIKAAAPTMLGGAVPPLDPAPGLRFVHGLVADDVVRAVLGVFGDEYDDAHFTTAAATAAGHMPVLVPQRTGSAGANRINAAMHDLFNPRARADDPVLELEDGTELRVGSWVMLTKNDSRKRVCNGDTAYVTAVDAKLGVTVLVEGSDTPEVKYTRGEAREQIRLAYASTVHKAQGSEYPWVVVVCHSVHRRMLTRRLLYTAITRAREGVVLVGDREGVDWAVGNAREVARCSWLKQRIGA